jgi:ATP-dependent Clp protease ATP-binding subunit ClpX
MEGAELHFTREAILEICEHAIQMKTGARALRSIMENIMLDVMYDLPSIKEPSKVTISAAVVRGKGKAKVLPLNPPKKNAA